MIQVGICGVAGQMGRTIAQLVIEDSDLAIGSACESPESDAIGQEVGQLIGVSSISVPIHSSLEALVSSSDVVVDFSHAEVTAQLGELCADHTKGLVIGTTGMSNEQIADIQGNSKTTPILLSPNMSVGVNVAFKLVELATQALSEDADVEIFEIHHSHKNDSPSGTAVKLGEIVANARDTSLDQQAIHGRQGFTGERKRGTIGFHSARGGDIVGEHTVIFSGVGERIEVTHRAQSRVNFAAGAIRATHFIANKRLAGEVGLFDMQSVLGLG